MWPWEPVGSCSWLSLTSLPINHSYILSPSYSQLSISVSQTRKDSTVLSLLCCQCPMRTDHYPSSLSSDVTSMSFSLVSTFLPPKQKCRRITLYYFFIVLNNPELTLFIVYCHFSCLRGSIAESLRERALQPDSLGLKFQLCPLLALWP